MGQKAHPKGLRLGIVEDWDSSWFSLKNYSDYVIDDIKIRKYIRDNMQRAGVADIKISRKSKKVFLKVFVSRVGIALGKGGEDVTRNKEELSALLGRKVEINVVEESSPEKNSKLLADSICLQLEKRSPFRRAMKMAVQWALKAGAQGVKVCCSGRLGGTEIARVEWCREGKVPLHTLRASIKYAFSEALTTYGKIGVKVWIYNGDIIDHNRKPSQDSLVSKVKNN